MTLLEIIWKLSPSAFSALTILLDDVKMINSSDFFCSHSNLCAIENCVTYFIKFHGLFMMRIKGTTMLYVLITHIQVESLKSNVT